MSKLLPITMMIFFVLSCSPQSGDDMSAGSYYTCSMHPEIHEKEPGKCPICHMNLTKVELDHSDHDVAPVKEQVWQCENFPDVTSQKKDFCPLDGTPMILKETDLSEVVAKIKIRKAQMQHFRPAFFPVSTMKMQKRVRLLGTVLQSEERQSNIPARIGGRVEKVYIRSTGSFIRVGDPVIDIYSPRLITAGEEYLLARNNAKKSKEFREMLKQSEERLQQWGIEKKQYQKWFKGGKVPRNITIYASATGIVRRKNAVVGKYFKEGQNFFELSDLSDVWVEMDVYEQDAALVKMGQKVTLEFIALPGVIVSGEIDFIDPVLGQKSRTLKVRTTVKNGTGKLKPGMVADATLVINFAEESLVVPRSAIIDTGKRKVVWIKINSRKYEAKIVHTGHESEGYIEIKHGVKEGDEVVIEGNFLLDAQAQLFGGYEDVPQKGRHH